MYGSKLTEDIVMNKSRLCTELLSCEACYFSEPFCWVSLHEYWFVRNCYCMELIIYSGIFTNPSSSSRKFVIEALMLIAGLYLSR